MLYKCVKCSKLFKNKTDFTRHKKRKTPCIRNDKTEEIFRCSECNKTYSSRGNLKRHNDNYCRVKHDLRQDVLPNVPKNFPTVLKVSQNVSKVSQNGSQIKSNDENSKKFKCNFCQKTFTMNKNLKRHLKSTCKIKIEIERQKEVIFIGLLEKMKTMENKMSDMDKMKNKIDELENENFRLHTINNTNNNTSNVNSHNQITNNNIINIQLVAFGKEDKEQLTNLELFKIIKKGFKSVPEFVKVLHFDENHPENHNIFIPNMRDGYVMIFDGEKWNLLDRVETIENLFDDGRNFLAEKKEQIKRLLSDKNRKVLIKFDRFDHDIDHCPAKKSEILTDIKLLLYNNKDIALKTKRQIECAK